MRDFQSDVDYGRLVIYDWIRSLLEIDRRFLFVPVHVTVTMAKIYLLPWLRVGKSSTCMSL